jgi:hypothetical protein
VGDVLFRVGSPFLPPPGVGDAARLYATRCSHAYSILDDAGAAAARERQHCVVAAGLAALRAKPAAAPKILLFC